MNEYIRDDVLINDLERCGADKAAQTGSSSRTVKMILVKDEASRHV